MTEHGGYIYDVFISYSPADEEWVDDWLMPRLTDAGIHAVTERNLVVGAFQVTDRERLIAESRHVIVVLTPDYLRSQWDTFESVLAQMMDVDARQRKLLPVLLRPCDPPVALKARVAARMFNQRWQERELKRLAQAISDTAPVPVPWNEGKARDWGAWRRWLQRYRRAVRWGVVVFFGATVLLAMVLRIPPFQDGPGWRDLHVPGRDLARVFRAGDVLLVSSHTDSEDCEDPGLWRSTDGGQMWDAVLSPTVMGATGKPGAECWLASLVDFAWTPADPGRILAATSDVGLLQSTDSGAHWAKVGEKDLPPQLTTVAVSPEASRIIFVAAIRGGVYRSADDGLTWRRIDEPTACPAGVDGATALPVGFRARPILATATDIYVGSESPGPTIPPEPSAGIYRSFDGGLCWRRVDDAQQRYDYAALDDVPGREGDLLALTTDHLESSTGGDHYSQLWYLPAGEGRRSLWHSSHPALALFLDAEPTPTWYVATWIGDVAYGRLAAAGVWDNLTSFWRCKLPDQQCSAAVDLTADARSGPPLLLMGSRVYRWEQVPWYRRLWP